MTEQFRNIDFSNICKKHKLVSLRFITQLFNGSGTQVVECIFGVRATNPESVDARLLKLDMQEYLPSEYAHVDITLLPNAIEEVEEIMDLAIRPYIMGHGGSILLEQVLEESGIITVSLKGACGTCPSALATMKYGVESILKEYLTWVTRVELANPPQEPDFEFHFA